MYKYILYEQFWAKFVKHVSSGTSHLRARWKFALNLGILTVTLSLSMALKSMSISTKRAGSSFNGFEEYEYFYQKEQGTSFNSHLTAWLQFYSNCTMINDILKCTVQCTMARVVNTPRGASPWVPPLKASAMRSGISGYLRTGTRWMKYRVSGNRVPAGHRVGSGYLSRPD